VSPRPRPPRPTRCGASGARAFFNDQRASKRRRHPDRHDRHRRQRQHQEPDPSARAPPTQGRRPNLLGLESSLGKVLPGGFDPANALNTNSATTNAGAGSVSRSEKISLTIAAVVSQVLPNGNMVIQGTQEVRTNAELRQLTVAGIVRPEDISSANTIKHTQIAEARISYGGRGDISRVQKTPAGQSLVEKFSPF
jgi:flagellar L-ring protein precursor FlgH